jgi:hypothetical protein
MKRLLCTGHIVPVPDWAKKCCQPIADADFEQAMIAQIEMPVDPEYFADQVINGVRHVVSWRGKHSTEVLVQ